MPMTKAEQRVVEKMFERAIERATRGNAADHDGKFAGIDVALTEVVSKALEALGTINQIDLLKFSVSISSFFVDKLPKDMRDHAIEVIAASLPDHLQRMEELGQSRPLNWDDVPDRSAMN